MRTISFQNAQNLAASNSANLCDTMAVTQDDTNLRGGHALLSQLADVLLNLQPSAGAASAAAQDISSASTA